MVAVARQGRMALWRCLEPGVVPAGAVRKEGEALWRGGVTSRPWCWGRRPDACPGRPSTPS
jgi:hypothetical protein